MNLDRINLMMNSKPNIGPFTKKLITLMRLVMLGNNKQNYPFFLFDIS